MGGDHSKLPEGPTPPGPLMSLFQAGLEHREQREGGAILALDTERKAVSLPRIGTKAES